MITIHDFLRTNEDATGHLNPIDREEVKELFRVVFDRYKTELTEFLKDLADKNEDDQLTELIKRLGDGGKDMSQFRKDADRMEIVPFTADSGADGDNPFGDQNN